LGMNFLGCGVSGGEEGARYGPSMMPGGSVEAWEACKPIFQVMTETMESILLSFSFSFSLNLSTTLCYMMLLTPLLRFLLSLFLR